MDNVLTPMSASCMNVLGRNNANKKADAPVCPPKPRDKRIKFKKGVYVWIHHPAEVWCKANILHTPHNGHMVVKHSTGKEEVVLVKDNYPLLCGVSSDWKQMDDLTKLNPLHEASVLECLGVRCDANQYYTKAGITLVAVNPFKKITGLYDAQVIKQYRSLAGSNHSKEQPPHVFAIAEQAFSAMRRSIGYMNQSIVVSGESGAGKTWTARCLMKYLASVAVPFNPGGFYPSPADCIEKRILDSNPLLEAFGNASTVRNHNSSRFGKYIQLQFDCGNHSVGASIQTYLLEKTRVVQQAETEHNFHIFYQLLLGATAEEQDQWGLTDAADMQHKFNYLQLSSDTVHTVDMPNIAAIKNAMHNVGIDNTKQQQVFQVLIGILHLGNLCFHSADDMDPCDLISEDCDLSLQYCSNLLGIDSDALVKSVMFRQITASHSSRRKSVFMRPCTVQEASTRRDCIAKLIYSRLFDWLVSSINSTTCAGKWHSFIGLLDIYGFENFHSNSLEQLCINYSNEKLQQHFVTHFLRAEQEEYQAEGIPWNYCNFTDNQPSLDAIESKMSVFTLMNEECNLNRQSNPIHFSQRVLDTVKSPHISQPHRSIKQPAFVINHYAEPVTYNAHGLIEKNKDHIPVDLVELLFKCNNSFVSQLVQTDTKPIQKQKNCKPTAKTVVAKFKLSLDSLMHTLNSTSPHYIRCIKPNTTRQPDVFDPQHIVSQLRACGVLETIKISAAGFPTKMRYGDFLQRYRMLVPMRNDVLHITRKSQCADIIDSLFADGKENHIKQALYGINKIFLADGQLEQLECQRATAIDKSVLCIQRAWRQYKRNMMMQWAATTIQAAFRGWKNRCYVTSLHDAARVIQHAMLMYYIRKQKRQLQEQLLHESQQNITTYKYAGMEDITHTDVSTIPDNEYSAVEHTSINHIAANLTSYECLNEPINYCFTLPGFSHQPAIHSGLDILKASKVRIQHSETDHPMGYFDEEIDGIDKNDCNNSKQDNTLMQILKTPAVDVALAATVTLLLLRGPISW